MPKRTHRIFSFLLLLFVAFAIALGAYTVYQETEKNKAAQAILAEEYQSSRYLCFSCDTLNGTEDLSSDPTPLSYRSRFRSYRSSCYESLLAPSDQSFYHLLEYALDHSFSSFFVEERILSSLERTPDEILTFFSLDSPLVEQNLSLREAETAFVLRSPDKRAEQEVEGSIFFISQFTKEKLNKKEEAIAFAHQLIAPWPEESQLNRAHRIYRYLTREVLYQAYEEKEERNYLYDALIGKKTQCDGFANAFSLLCQLSGISSFEKLSLPQEEQAGHTWNSFLAEGVWYNADCSLSQDAVEDEIAYDFSARFAYSDRLQSEPAEYGELLPVCEMDRTPVSLSYSPETASSFVQEAEKAFRTNRSRYILIEVHGEIPEESLLQELANRLRSSLSAVGYEWNQREYWFLFQIDEKRI